MRIPADMVAMNGEEYRRHVELKRNEREILRCLMALDIAAMRKVWQEMAPHLDQPESDWAALHAMHMARVEMNNISPQAKRYSEHWLRELKSKTRIAAAVGIAVKPFAGNVLRAREVQAEMSEAVALAVREGVDIELEVPELHRRMLAAKQRVHGRS